MKRIIDDHSCSVFLLPGKIIVSHNPVIVSTLLGSCVAVTMYCREARVGAICHAMLPHSQGEGDSLLYVDVAVRQLYRKVREHDPTADLTVKLFGGARVLACVEQREGRLTVGEQNIAAAERVLGDLGLSIAGADVGGNFGRKLFFSMKTGQVYLKKLNSHSGICCRSGGIVPLP